MSKLKPIVISVLLAGVSGLAFGDSIEWNSDVDVSDALTGLDQNQSMDYFNSHNQNSYYISNFIYQQSLFNQVISGGGTQMPPSDVSSMNVWERLFSTGTYNVYGGAMGTVGSNNSKLLANGTANNTIAYGFNGFAQTGQVGGFSAGIAATAMNPFFDRKLSHGNEFSNDLMPTDKQIALTEGFVEYQYKNRVGVDVGYIGINNSPWITSNFNASMVGTEMTYQGALANIYAGNGWLLTGLFFNGAQAVGSVGFTGETLLNNKYGENRVSSDQNSQYTLGLGSDYKAFDNNYNLRLWAYQFENFGTMFYADNSLTLPINKTVKFNFALQGGIDNSLGMNTAYSNTTGNINSYFAGGQAGISVDWFNLTLSGDTIWGTPIVSPYTGALGTDPLYATGLITNMVDMGLTGNAFQVSPTVSFLDDNLSISANYMVLKNMPEIWEGTQEAYLTMNYFIPQVKGLQVNTSLGYQWVPSINPENNQWTGQLITSYLW